MWVNFFWVRMQIRRLPGGTWSEVYTGTEHHFLDQTLAPAQIYEYRAKASNERGASDYSTAFAVETPSLHAPEPPDDLTLRNVDGGGVMIAWEAGFITDAVLIERRTDGPVGWETEATVTTDFPGVHLDADVLPGFKYDYRLSASNAAGTSDYLTGSITVIDGECLLAEDFDDGLVSTWFMVSGGRPMVDGGQGFPSGGVLWFGEIGTRSLRTAPLDVSRGGALELRFRGGNSAVDGAEFWDDSEAGERVHVQYSSDGVLWFTMATLDPAVDTDWTDHYLEIPWEARSTATRFRLIQESNSGPDFDTWAVDWFCVFGHRFENRPPVFAAHTPSVLSMNGAADPVTLDLKPFVSDPDTLDRMYYAIEAISNPDLFSTFGVGLTDGILNFEMADYTAGSSDVTVRVTDEAGAAATSMITVNVPSLALPSITREGSIEFNQQTGLFEHSLTVANNGERAIGGFYLRATGLGADYTLYGFADDTIRRLS